MTLKSSIEKEIITQMLICCRQCNLQPNIELNTNDVSKDCHKAVKMREMLKTATESKIKLIVEDETNFFQDKKLLKKLYDNTFVEHISKHDCRALAKEVHEKFCHVGMNFFGSESQTIVRKCVSIVTFAYDERQ